MRAVIEVLGDLLNALADHRSLDDVLRPHPTSGHGRSARPIGTERGIDLVGWDLRARSEYLPDLEGALELYHLDYLH